MIWIARSYGTAVALFEVMLLTGCGSDAVEVPQTLLSAKTVDGTAIGEAEKNLDRDAADGISKHVAEKESKIDHDTDDDDVKDVVDLLDRFKDNGQASAAIVGNLYEGGVITNEDLAAEASTLQVSKSDLDTWFDGGCPSQSEIADNRDLQNLIAAVSEKHFDYAGYQESYQIAFHDYFEK